MEVCKYQMFGLGKFKDNCKNQHLAETCENLTACENVKSCHKRHPRVAKDSLWKRSAVSGLTVPTNTRKKCLQSNQD